MTAPGSGDAAGADALFADEPCAGCESPPGPYRRVSWSPVFGLWLCGYCLQSRTERELGDTERANAKAAFAAHPAAGADK